MSETKKSKSEKSRPMEFSCRAPVAVPKPKRQGLPRRSDEEVLDPRFNREVAGDFDGYKFGKAYSFLSDYRDSERKDLADRLSSKKLSEEERFAAEKALARMVSQDAARKRMSEELEIRRELKTKELEVVAKSGKRAYYHPRSAIKKIMRERQDSALSQKGQLDKVRSKQERRQLGRERKSSSMPKTRRVVEVTDS